MLNSKVKKIILGGCMLVMACLLYTSYTQLAETHHIPLHSIADKEALGTAIGKEVRVVVAVLDDGFAKALLKEIDR